MYPEQFRFLYLGIFVRGKSSLRYPGDTVPITDTRAEFSSGMYSPEVFTIAQLLGELPYCILCAIVYWIIMVIGSNTSLYPYQPRSQIFAQGFGQGSAGLGGTGLQLVVIIFVELFGVSLGQFVAAITPSVQVGILFDPFIMVTLTIFCLYTFDLSSNPTLSALCILPGGVIIPYANLAHTWKESVYQLNPFTRLLSAMLSTELQCVMI